MEINIFSSQQEFHRFTSDDFMLASIGMGSYTISSLNNFLTSNNGGLPQDIQELFGNNAEVLRTNFVNKANEGSILEFLLDTKVYRPANSFQTIATLNSTKYPPSEFTQPPTNILQFLSGWNDVQRGYITTPAVVNGYRAVVYKIQTSASGCLVFPTTYTILGMVRTSNIRLDFLESNDPESSRSISIKGSPVITALPAPAHGMKYSARATAAAAAGQYITPGQDGVNNPENTISAPLGLAYDPSTGEFQSGTQQMLMRLVEDLDPAPVPNIDGEEALSATREDYYENGEESPFFMKFSGPVKAIPLSSENGNVHMFGPDYKNGCDGGNQVTVRVINRLNVAYKAGSVVVCSKLLGDAGVWTVISGVGKAADEAERKILFGNFEYQQYIIPANLYFTAPTADGAAAPRLYPDVWASKMRLDYYLKLYRGNGINDQIRGGYDTATFNIIATLNLFASNLSGNEEDPKSILKQEFLNNQSNIAAKITQWTADSKINNTPALEFFQNNYLNNNNLYRPLIPTNEHQPTFAFPKNINKRSADTIPLGMPSPNSPFDLGVLEVPVFWGMLFPDGYKVETTRQFRELTNGGAIYKDDTNLSEISCAGTECVYDFSDQVKSFRFGQLMNVANPLTYVRKTGGLYRDILTLNGIIADPAQITRLIFMEGGVSTFDRRRLASPSDSVWGLEPVNPSKIQFSSLTWEGLYSNSTINSENSGFRYLRDVTSTSEDVTSILSYTAQLGDVTSATLKAYASFWLWGGNTAQSQGSDPAEIGNTYNIKPLAISNAIGSNAILLRHSPPFGTLKQGSFAPTLGSDARGVAMPILTCKSTISTNAAGLQFNLQQSIGQIKRQVVTPGQGPTVTFLPLGAVGVGWNTASEGPKRFGFVQWGNGENDIDTFGTTALRVRIFEHVPPNQLIYLGPIFTPLHFSASDPIYKLELVPPTESNPSPSIRQKDPLEFNTTPLDFKAITFKDNINSTIPVNTVVNSNIAADFAQWKTIYVRRGKLLSNGGFACVKPIVVLQNIVLLEGGINYKNTDKLSFSDGSEATINTDNGVITSVREFKPNFNSIFITTTTNGFTTFAPTIVANGGSGSGARFTATYVVKYDIIYDPPPKESTQPRGALISSPNGRGEEYIVSQKSSSVDLVRTGTNKKFDIFYYYHNDPTHHSLDEFMQFSHQAAQYIISEVRPQ